MQLVKVNCLKLHVLTRQSPFHQWRSFHLLGPPELHRQTTTPPPPPQCDDPFTSAMVTHFNRVPFAPSMGFTENNSPTFLSTGNPCLDFFFHIVPNTPSQTLTSRLHDSWSYDALTTLKLIFNLGGVRGTGKADREGFYTALLWLHRHHPKTLAGNVSSVAMFGYFKSLLEILYRLLEGPDLRRNIRKWPPCPPASMIGEIRERKRIEKAKKALDRFYLDPDFRFLHERISDLFAYCLKSDLRNLNSGRINKIGLSAKWCPSLNSSFDRSTLLCETIARKIFPRESSPDYADIEDAHYAYRVRDRLRKEVLVPLRRAMHLPEVYMSANRWSELPYNRVASVAMKTYQNLFQSHDLERFNAYLKSVMEGKAKIAAGALLPHEVIRSVKNDYVDGGCAVADLQWRRMVDDLGREGKMKNCIAVCDVSGSMSGIPMEVSVALGILVSELSEEPWKGKVITFSESPYLHVIKGGDLREKVRSVEDMYWGMNTDFQKVFDRILEVAVEAGVKKEEMIKRVIVFSDMEFDEACRNPMGWETDYMVIRRKYEERGYCVPEIVFWNLRDSAATPVKGDQEGVALVSGFSKNLLKMFMRNDGIVTPLEVMEAAISGRDYQKLVVFD